MLAHWTRRHRMLAVSATVAAALAATGIIVYIQNISLERDRADAALSPIEVAKNDLLEHAELLLHSDPTAAFAALSSYRDEDDLREVLAVRSRALSPTHPDTLDAQETLGICLHRSGRALEALPLLEHNLAEREAQLGPNAPALAGPLGNLAGALSDLHRDGEALSLLERALALREAAYGADDPRVAVRS